MDFYSFCRYHVAYLRLILSESESCVTGAEMTKRTATELRCGITLCCCQDNHFCLLQDNGVCPVIKSVIQTPRRETYYPCEGLISGTFNGDYYIFYHNYFMFSKIQVSYGYHIQVFLLKNYIIFITHVHNTIY